MNAEAGLNAQIEHLRSHPNVPLADGTVLGYELGKTGEGKGMRLADSSPDGKRWSCHNDDNLQPVEGLNKQVRWGAFLKGQSAPAACWGLCP